MVFRLGWCGSGGVEKRLGFGCILKMELMGLVYGWNVGVREREGRFF